MKVLFYTLRAVGFVLLLPFMVIDIIFINIPKEIKAKKWRKTAKVGDRGYFNNTLGGKTEFTIESIDRRRKESFSIESRGYASRTYQTIDPESCYPL